MALGLNVIIFRDEIVIVSPVCGFLPFRFENRTGHKEASNNKLNKIALRFWSDLAVAIEQNRRRSRATSRIL